MKKKPEVTTDCYFGGCPHCGKTDGFFNLRRAHYFVCHKHRVRWYVGDNIFRAWRRETPADWDSNAKRFADYVDVEPVAPPPDKWKVTATDPFPVVTVESAVWLSDYKRRT